MATNKTLAAVTTRAQAHLNDRTVTLWTQALLLQHEQAAYEWMFSEIDKYVDAPFENIAELTYTADTKDLTSIMPADLYLPTLLEYRRNTDEEWVHVDRKDRLPSRETEDQTRVIEWRWRTRTIFVNSASENGLLRLTYDGLLPDLTASGDAILMDNVVRALAYYTAHDAYDSRGQARPSERMMRLAQLAIDQVTDKMVLNEQLIERTGVGYSGGNLHNHHRER